MNTNVKKQNILYTIISLPIVFNFIQNLMYQDSLLNELYFNFSELIGGVVLIIFLVFVGKSINSIFLLNSISIGIVYYLFSFPLFDYILIFFNFTFTFQTIFLITNVFWITILTIKKQYFLIFISLLLFAINRFVHLFLYENYFKNFNITGDVEAVFLAQAKNIYEFGYFYSMSNQVMDGYPQFLSYIQALVFQITLNVDKYEIISVNTQIFLFLFLLFIFELRISKYIKFLMILTTLSLIFNSKWLTYLFFNSLMGEGLLSYLCVVLIFAITKSLDSNKRNYLLVLIFGCLMLTKHFIIEISFLILIFLIYKKRRTIYIFGLLPYLLNQLLILRFFQTEFRDHHISQVDVSSVFYDLVTLNNLEFKNIRYIFEQVFIDKPFTYLIVVFLIVIFFELLLNNPLNEFKLLLSIAIFLNFLFVLILYISIWKNMELESPIRYFLNFLYPYICFIFINLKKDIVTYSN